MSRNKKLALIVIPSLFVFFSVFFSYSKTSMLGFAVSVFLFFILTRKYILGKDLSEKEARVVKFFPPLLVFTAAALVFVKQDLFLHLGSMINRLDNLQSAIQRFFYNPI
jgi:hypothetical protein